MKRLLLCLMVVLLCMASGLTQSRRKKLQSKPTSVTAKVQELAQQMIGDGQLTRDCVEKSGGIGKVVSLKVEDLNRDGTPDYLITLNNPNECTEGATLWCYRKTSRGYVMLLGADIRTVGVIDHFSRGRTDHNGFVDLEVVVIQSSWAEAYVFVFNGTSYVEARHTTERIPG